MKRELVGREQTQKALEGDMVRVWFVQSASTFHNNKRSRVIFGREQTHFPATSAHSHSSTICICGMQLHFNIPDVHHHTHTHTHNSKLYGFVREKVNTRKQYEERERDKNETREK